jgi:hypothetical protein
MESELKGSTLVHRKLWDKAEGSRGDEREKGE